jgi:hypothetical protein
MKKTIERNSKRIRIYQDKKTGAIFINPEKVKDGKFVLKSPIVNYGSANSKNISDKELGKKVKEALEQAD